jgi:pyruvate/2-oxoglutarate dehydrogenase complex dihydrolipoamide dehydrogenase (E3) component
LKTKNKTRNSYDYDLAILGGGSAGYAAARTATDAGLKTVVIDGGSELGGLCILRGCMPSKALLYAAEVLHLARVAKTWGLKIPQAGFDFKAVMARKREMVEEFARYRRGQLTGGKFKLLRAQAGFVDGHTLALRQPPGSSPKSVTARNFIVSTGSMPAPPPLPELRELGYLTSDEALSLWRLPRSLIVLGGGLVAVELAQFFCRFGVKVTVIQRSRHLLRECDEDVGATLEKVFRGEKIQLHTDTRLRGVFRKGREKGIVFESGARVKRVAAEEILVALGRVPATVGLGLENIGVQTENGRIVTNSSMQTAVPHVYAAGDCTGPHQIVHIAVEQGEIAAGNIIHPAKKRQIDYRLLCSVAFTDPQVAVAGLTEKEAKARQIAYLAASYPFNDHGKSIIMGVKHGFVKLLADPRSGEILGGACVGPTAGELIHEIIAAMRHHMTVGELAVMPHYHPTLAEIWTYPASELAEKIK